MGCGKSSVGKRLSELLCCRFADLDTVIEEIAGCSVAEIFERFGEAEFRRMEQETLKETLETHCRVYCHSERSEESSDMVLALGGGAVMTEGSDRMVHEGSFCVYLRTSVDEIVARLSSETAGRPLLADSDLRTRILDLMSRRASTYERVAHLIIDTDGKSIDEISHEIIVTINPPLSLL